VQLGVVHTGTDAIIEQSLIQASIFVQSHVPAHAELTWLLSCVTPISWLNKMIQFKEKARKSVSTVHDCSCPYTLFAV
jgi:tryptophanyl-tRNA synthetase